MNRPKVVDEWMKRWKDGYFGAHTTDNEIAEYVNLLESQLPPEPEEAWSKCEHLHAPEQKCLLIYKGLECIDKTTMQIRHIDEILRNREIVRRGIDWEPVIAECVRLGFHNVVSMMNTVKTEVERQLKGGK